MSPARYVRQEGGSASDHSQAMSVQTIHAPFSVVTHVGGCSGDSSILFLPVSGARLAHTRSRRSCVQKRPLAGALCARACSRFTYFFFRFDQRPARRFSQTGKEGPVDALQANKCFGGPQFGAASAGVHGDLLFRRSHRFGSQHA
jgi:hypothetical protein